MGIFGKGSDKVTRADIENQAGQVRDKAADFRLGTMTGDNQIPDDDAKGVAKGLDKLANQLDKAAGEKES
jgi:hypothetical protein